MVLTCPGKMRALTFSSGSPMSTSSAPGMFLCAAYTLKLASPIALARLIAMATSGVVVSKPTPTKMTGRVGFSLATVSASRGEYTMRMSRPAACSLRSELVEPGTRVMSPKVVIITFGTRESAMTVSMSWLLVTHTGQPGPLARRQPSGMSERMPFRAMATVCVPHTSIRVACSGASAWMLSMSPRASTGSLKLFWSTMAATYIAGAGCTSSANSGNWRIRSSVSFAACSLTTSIANPACTNT